MKVQPPKSDRRARKRLVLPVRPELVTESRHDLRATPTAAVAALRTTDSHVDIALAAYFIAEKRGFAPGHELDDWLAAEAEIAKPEEPSVVKPVQLVEEGRVS